MSALPLDYGLWLLVVRSTFEGPLNPYNYPKNCRFVCESQISYGNTCLKNNNKKLI